MLFQSFRGILLKHVHTINQAVAGFGLYPKAPKEFNLFWLTSLPQSFAPLEYTTLLRLQTNQQLVDLLFTILSTPTKYNKYTIECRYIYLGIKDYQNNVQCIMLFFVKRAHEEVRYFDAR